MKKWLLLSLGCFAPVALGHIPEQAFQACAELSAGDSCRAGPIKGQCRRITESQNLVCVPSRQNSARTASNSRRGPIARKHEVVQSDGLKNTVPADQDPIAPSEVEVTVQGEWRVIEANGISKHKTGAFPNPGNPNVLRVQNYIYRVPANPKVADKITPLIMQNFGFGINGVPFDPNAAEWFLGNRGYWRYEALSGAIALGVDDNLAHVQPTGAYHYHGLPFGLLKRLQVTPKKHSPLVGWAADGFPIYALYSYKDPQNTDSEIVQIHSSYQLKPGNRPTGNKQPGGYYDGTFISDYEYVKGSGSLDECNGRFVRTPEFPQGTYAYFLTEEWPVVPRCYRGTPSKDFSRGGRR